MALPLTRRSRAPSGRERDAVPPRPHLPADGPFSADLLDRIQRYWPAANLHYCWPDLPSGQSATTTNGFSHQGPGLIDVMLSKRGSVARIYLPPDANCLLSVADHCLRSRNYVNLIAIGMQPQLRWLKWMTPSSIARGASVWEWASNARGIDPDLVLACPGDTPTLDVLERPIPQVGRAAWSQRSGRDRWPYALMTAVR
jgi:hypothetical protein